ncbi:Ionotropic receptor 41a9 [Blattella germanica]|nr:Ionotropic receptor 41a9 [Blattella germanica]
MENLGLAAMIVLGTTAVTAREEKLMGTMTREVILKFFTNIKINQCICIVTEESNDFLDFIFPIDYPTFHVNISLNLMKNSNPLDEPFEGYDWDTLFLVPINSGCLAFIVQTSDIKFMVKTFARLFHTPKSIYRSNRKYLYLPAKNVDFENVIKDLFQMREIDFMPDLVLAKLKIKEEERKIKNNILKFIKDDSHFADIELITHRFVGPRPGSSETVLLDTWTSSEGFTKKADLYPDKMSNLMGKELILCSLHYPPAAVINDIVDPPIYDGTEFRFMNEFSRTVNFSWKVLHKQDEWWGDVWDNGTGTGPVGYVSMDQADFGFSLLYLFDHEHHFMDFSTYYYHSSLTTALPKPKLLPEWQVIICPFNFDMWLAILISILISTAALLYTSKLSMRFLVIGKGDIIPSIYSTWTECGFRTMGLVVLQVPPDERDWSTPRYVPMRHLVTWLILFYFVVTTGYGGGLASVLTLPRFEPPIDTPAEMADRGSIWAGTSDNYIAFLKESTNPKLKIMGKHFYVLKEEALADIAETGKIGIALERMLGGNFVLPYYINERTMKNFRVMRDNYFSGHCAFYMRKGSPYMKHINIVVRNAREAGLFFYWEYLTVRLYMNARDQLAVSSSRQIEDPGRTPLRVSHGSLYLLLYGLVLAGITFVLEIAKQRYLKKKEKKLFRDIPVH